MTAGLVSISPRLETSAVHPKLKKGSTLIWWLVFIALIARVPGMFTDFWLDEIWTHNVASQLHSANDVIFSEPARIDNNHPLNTVLMRAFGLGAAPWTYRVPSLLAGIGCALLVAKRNARAGLFIALSFPFVFYSSEARGYMPAVFFAIVAFESMVRNRERFTASSVVVFNIACILGFLSHLTFVHFYLAAMCWSFFWIRRVENSVARQALRWFALHAIPIAFVATFYRVFVKHLVIGGAPPRSTVDVLISTWSMLIGGPEANSSASRAIACVFAAIAIGAFMTSVIAAARRRDDRWLFDVLAVIVAPAFLLAYDLILSARPQPLMVRYFLVAMVFAGIAIARGASELLSRRAIIVAVSIFVVANLVQLISFLHVGRGGYERAMDRVLARSGSAPAAVNGDRDFRVGEIVRFYNRRRSALRQVPYTAAPADWLIVSSPETQVDPAYQLDSVYPSSSLSGTVWRLYHRAAPAVPR